MTRLLNVWSELSKFSNMFTIDATECYTLVNLQRIKILFDSQFLEDRKSTVKKPYLV